MNGPLIANGIGVAALAIGAVISAFQGSLLLAFAGFLLLVFLTGTLLPPGGKLTSRVPRFFMFQRIGRLAVSAACWGLVILGGGAWQYVPAGIVLTGSILSGPLVRMINRFRGGTRIQDQQNAYMTDSSRITIDAPPPIKDNAAPPLYTSTVQIVEKQQQQQQQQHQQQQPTVPISIQTPVINSK